MKGRRFFQQRLEIDSVGPAHLSAALLLLHPLSDPRRQLQRQDAFRSVQNIIFVPYLWKPYSYGDTRAITVTRQIVRQMHLINTKGSFLSFPVPFRPDASPLLHALSGVFDLAVAPTK